jgi:ubiquinone/menaquinone biosynthesis C-methylase UbiE
MDLKEYRESSKEQRRINDLMALIPSQGESALDIGSRDGFLAVKLTGYYDKVTALDLIKPDIEDKTIECVRGNITDLRFPDNTFDLVLCAEVLEHIQPHLLQQACSELYRVSKKHVLIGVPYKQDTRFGRTTCYSCGKKNPPYGHVNSFDESRLRSLFPGMREIKVSYIGETKEKTNFLSTYFLDLAGNPYGTYHQEETCIYCENRLKNPPERSFIQKVFTKLAFLLRDIQSLFVSSQPNWIHILFEK